MIKKLSKLPVILVASFMFVMFVIDSLEIFPSFEFRHQSIVSFTIFGLGFLVISIGGYTFRKVNTTVNPMTPDLTSYLVRNGIYGVSRNPMYIGFFSWLVACGLFVGNVANIFLFPLYVILVNKLYIIPEEEALRNLFGKEFEKYEDEVNRWL